MDDLEISEELTTPPEGINSAAPNIELIEVLSATHMEDSTPELTILLIRAIVAYYGVQQEEDVVWRHGDPYGLGPQIDAWALLNPTFPITPYTPPPEPTIEEIRAAMPALQRLDFKTRFKNAGMGLTKVNAYLTSIEADESHWEDMYNYWNETLTFTRLSAFVVELAVFSAKTPEQIDVIWTA
jgi:hypothetical protein